MDEEIAEVVRQSRLQPRSRLAASEAATGPVSVERRRPNEAVNLTCSRWAFIDASGSPVTPVSFLGVWIAFIFATSCTVIRPDEFFGLVQRYAIVDATAMSRFRVIWGPSWFAIVKGWNFAEFAILTLRSVHALRIWRQTTGPKEIVAAMLCCMAFAASDEWHQSFVPDRYGTFTDVLIDSLGILSAGAVLLRRQSLKGT